jgi:hypothetical protein
MDQVLTGAGRIIWRIPGGEPLANHSETLYGFS